MKLTTIAAALFVSAALAASVPAEAGRKHRHGGHRNGHGHRHTHGVVVHPAPIAPRVFVAPRVITAPYVSTYRPYYYDHVWHTGHRHDHDVYYFPVRAEFGYTTEPYVYCGGRLYGSGYVAYEGPRVSVRLAF